MWPFRAFGALRASACLLAAAVPLLGQRPPRALLPDAALVAVEVGDAGAVTAGLLAALGPLPTELPEEVRALVATGLFAVRLALGSGAVEFAADVAGGGAALGLLPDGKTAMALLVLRPGDPAATVARLQKLAGERGHFAVDGEWVLGSSAAAGLELLAAQRRAGDGRWARWPGDGAAAAASVRAAVDLDGLRGRWPALGRVLESVDAGGRFFVGPLAYALQQAHWLRAELTGGRALTLSATVDASVDGTAWRQLQAGAARTILAPPPATLAVVALDRALRPWLEQPASFLRPADVPSVQSFLSVADQLDGAQSSVLTDLLGSLREPAAFYVLAATAPAAEGPPLLLPAFALAVPTVDGRAAEVLRRMAQALVLISNGERGQRGQKPFVLRARRDEGDGVTGLLAELAEWRGPGRPPLEYGMQPALLFGHGQAVLATTAAAAEQLLAQARDGAVVEVQGDLLQLFGGPTAAWLLRNERPLRLQRALDEGGPLDDARRFLLVLHSLLSVLDDTTLRVQARGQRQTTLEWQLRRRP